MKIIRGKAASAGLAIGTLLWLERREIQTEKRGVIDPEAEVRRFFAAREKAIAELIQLEQQTREKLGEENALLFEIHRMMLLDEDYEDSVCAIIRDAHTGAEHAVEQTAETFAAGFAAMEDAYMQARAADVRDASRGLLEQLAGGAGDEILPEQAGIYAAADFSPSETARFDRENVWALVTEGGAETGHAAIFARTMGLPAVMGLGVGLKEWNGAAVIVDGDEGLVITEPDEETLRRYHMRSAAQSAAKLRLDAVRGVPSITRDGQRVELCANIGSVSDATTALENDAEGVGLFRSEFLYLQESDYPSEETQYAAYKAVCEKFSPRRVIIRTLDIGADKQAAYFGLEKEENPALGYRAIRICLDRTEVFKTQLRALLRAGAHGRLAIMLPMITAPWEAEAARALLEEAKRELLAAGKAHATDVELGIMIETPAAAMVSDKLAKAADFFSVGTNDLTQYSLAIDRQNSRLGRYLDKHHLGLLRLIRRAADSIHKEGKWIGVCGELAADKGLTELFLAMGIDELSMAPAAILPLRAHIRSLDLTGRREALLEALDWD
ncbi:MAG: phosphoenolpyruvate--protein phosphotransferase [Candidatus Pelethousia sp.]|nr:phosphoenolpyruvate--protein phosphotransferase [Candidatus Pelethousia sp.]